MTDTTPVADARQVPEAAREVSCNACGNYFPAAHMTDTGKCQACANRDRPADTTTPVSTNGFDRVTQGDFVAAVDVYGNRHTGQYLVHQPETGDYYDDYAHSYPVYHSGDAAPDAFYRVLLAVDRRRRTHTISQIVTEHPEFVPPTTPIGDIHTMLNGNPNGYAFKLVYGVHKVERRTTPPPLRPCDGIYLASEPNSLDGDGGEVPLPSDQTIDRVALVIQQGGSQAAEDYGGYNTDWYEAWIPATGEHIWFNRDNTQFAVVFRATEQNWCPDRRRPILALANAMRNEYERWQIEDRGGYET